MTDNLKTESTPDNVTEMPKPKPCMTLAEVRKLRSLPKDQQPDIMPRFISIGSVVYDMSKEAERNIILKALHSVGLDYSSTVRKRNPAPVLPLASQFERNKKSRKAMRKMSRARG